VRRHFGARDGDYVDDVLTRRALRFISANRSARRPFFAWLNLYAPHLVPPGAEAHAGRCRGSAIPAPGGESRFKAGAVSTSRSFGVRHVSDKPLAVRVPLIVWAPRKVLGAESAPQWVSQATANIDLAPTLLPIASATPCRNSDRCRVMDGRSFLPLLKSRADAWPSHRAILLESREGDFGICRFEAVRTTRHVYAEYSRFVPGSGGECAPPSARELYDLDADPAELRNLLPPRPGSRRRASGPGWQPGWIDYAPVRVSPVATARRQGTPSAGSGCYRSPARVEITAS
jgi:hypothetical protein